MNFFIVVGNLKSIPYSLSHITQYDVTASMKNRIKQLHMFLSQKVIPSLNVKLKQQFQIFLTSWTCIVRLSLKQTESSCRWNSKWPHPSNFKCVAL